MATFTGSNSSDLLPILPTSALGNDTFFGLGGNDILAGYSGNDTINGGQGADLIIGGALNIVLNVGTISASGVDTADYSSSAAGVSIDLSMTHDLTVAMQGIQIGLTGASFGTGGDAQGDILTGITNLTGSNSIDALSGNDQANVLRALGGNDLLNGHGGADVMEGGAGNDTYYVDSGDDKVVEAFGQGSDQVLASVDYTLDAGVEVEALKAASDAPAVGVSLVGNEFGQTITGNEGGGFLKGKGGNDVIAGNGGGDALYGGVGMDTLAGGAGNDQFYFDTAPNAATNVDIITDFANVAGNNDTIRLENAVFTALTATGFLAAGAFQANATGIATQADDRIIYETDTGKLFYDGNGSAAGGGVQFATIADHAALTGAEALSAADFLVV